jgi:hypothetical protein
MDLASFLTDLYVTIDDLALTVHAIVHSTSHH